MPPQIDVPGIGTLEASPEAFKESYRVLLVDDDEDFRDSLTRRLSKRHGMTIDPVKSLTEGTGLLASRRYDAILADVRMDDNPSPSKPEDQGDFWLLSHLQDIDTALKCVVTGQEQRILSRSRLADAGVRVIIKGTPEAEALWEELATSASRRVEERRLALEAELARAADRAMRVSPKASTDLSSEVLGLLTAWLSKRAQDGSRAFVYKGREYSFAALLEEVRTATPVGQAVARMFLQLVAVRLGLRSPSGGPLDLTHPDVQ